ncbi:hypothetical protein D3C74_444760 [compost metagenome]
MPDKLEKAHKDWSQRQPNYVREEDRKEIKDIGDDQINDHCRLRVQRIMLRLFTLKYNDIEQTAKITGPAVFFKLMHQDRDEAEP